MFSNVHLDTGFSDSLFAILNSCNSHLTQSTRQPISKHRTVTQSLIYLHLHADDYYSSFWSLAGQDYVAVTEDPSPPLKDYSIKLLSLLIQEGISPLVLAAESCAVQPHYLRPLGSVHPEESDFLVCNQLLDALGQELLRQLLSRGRLPRGGRGVAARHELPQLPPRAGARGEEEDGVHKALEGRLALRGFSGGQPRPPAPAERLGGRRDLRAVPLEVEERLLQAVVGEGGAGRRPGQDGGGSPRPEPLRQLLLEAGPGAGPRRAEAAAPRGPAAAPERVEEPEGPAEAGQAEAAAQVVEEPQSAALEPLPPAGAGRVQEEHHAVGARHGARSLSRHLTTARRPPPPRARPAGPVKARPPPSPGTTAGALASRALIGCLRAPAPSGPRSPLGRGVGAPAQRGARAEGGRGTEGRRGAGGSSGAPL